MHPNVFKPAPCHPFFMNNSFVQVCLGKIKNQYDWLNQGIPCENVTMKNDFLS